VSEFRPARSIDREYARLLKEACAAGVEILTYQCKLDLEGISLRGRIPFSLE
jgi:sugar fermentation stimulation protein A